MLVSRKPPFRATAACPAVPSLLHRGNPTTLAQATLCEQPLVWYQTMSSHSCIPGACLLVGTLSSSKLRADVLIQPSQSPEGGRPEVVC